MFCLSAVLKELSVWLFNCIAEQFFNCISETFCKMLSKLLPSQKGKKILSNRPIQLKNCY